QLLDVDDLDQLVQLAGDLVQLLGADVQDDRHPGDLGILGGTDDQVVDAEAAAGEEDRDPGEDAGVVLDQDGQCVTAHDVLLVKSGCPCGRVCDWDMDDATTLSGRGVSWDARPPPGLG